MKKTPVASSVLLCGGSSERLGFPKEMLRVDGAPLGLKLADLLAGLFPSVAISSNRPRYLRYLTDAPILEDAYADAGPLAGIHAGLKHADTERVFFLACDMPAVDAGVIERITQHAADTDAQVIIARCGRQTQPLCGVYSRSLLPLLERRLGDEGEGRSVHQFLETLRVEHVDIPDSEQWRLRDLDAPEDLWLLGLVFDDVEPLPVQRVSRRRFGGEAPDTDMVAEEWAVALHVNGVKIVTTLCLPTALTELAVGFASYLGLVDRLETVRGLEVDYEARRVNMELDVEDARIKNAIQILVTSTCGANVYGSELPQPPALTGEGGFTVPASHVLDCLSGLRHMAPVYERTGCTHQAAFSDGDGVRCFFEDIGRHNALDKVLGRAIMDGRDTTAGLLVATGRISSEMVVKALRQRVPVVASRSAVTSNALRVAEARGLTVVGFARGRRLNAYTGAERLLDENPEGD